MNYAFKMMAVVMALGMLVLSGCQTVRNISYNITSIDELGDDNICWRIKNKVGYKYNIEAKRRGLNCGFDIEINTSISFQKKIKQYSNYVICMRSKWKFEYLPYATDLFNSILVIKLDTVSPESVRTPKKT